MSADGNAATLVPAPVSRAHAGLVEIELIGTGQVGRALLRRVAALGELRTTHDRRPLKGASSTPSAKSLRVVAVGNSRGRIVERNGIDVSQALDAIESDVWPPRIAASTRPAAGADRACRIVVDATASDDIASRHDQWLAQGVSVVTANKLGQGASLARWRAIDNASRITGASYGNSATVGAGLPFIRTLESLANGGDRILSLAGVLSGTLAWLFDNYDGSTPFSQCVHRAQALGITEPDPWQDIGGQDVIRKLLILARTVGHALDIDGIDHSPLVATSRIGDWSTFDRTIAERIADARSQGAVLRHVARLDEDGRARVGLECLQPDDPLALGGGSNRLVIHTCRYREQPLIIQGPGAGADITAAALLDDILRIAGQ